jgi:hypothetical protein
MVCAERYAPPEGNDDTGGEFIKSMFCVGKDNVKSRYPGPFSQFATSINDWVLGLL